MSLARAGDYKLIQKFAGPVFELYNLRNDPTEAINLAETEPSKLESMKKMLTTWQMALKAPLADQPNPAYDPLAKEPRGGGKKGGKGAPVEPPR